MVHIGAEEDIEFEIGANKDTKKYNLGILLYTYNQSIGGKTQVAPSEKPNVTLILGHKDIHVFENITDFMRDGKHGENTYNSEIE